jgi:hypothetical protein
MEDKLKEAPKKRQRAPKKWLKLMAGIFVLGGAYTGWSMYSSSVNLNNVVSGNSAKLNKAGNVTSLAGDSGSTPYYNELVRQNNTQKEEEVRGTNKSFMPTMTSDSTQTVKGIDNTVLDSEPENETTTYESIAPASRASQQNEEDVLVVSPTVMAAMEAYLGQWRAGTPVSTVIYDNPDPSLSDGGEGVLASQTVTGSDLDFGVDPLDNPLTVGGVLYGGNVLNVNSDQPSTPVVAEVLSGKHQGGKFIGGFALENDRLVLRYSKFIDKQGNEYPVVAYAIDYNIKSAAVRTHIDNHTLLRWGSLVAAGFIDGVKTFAETSIQNNEQTTITSNGTVIESNEGISSGEQIALSLGSVGDRVADRLEDNFDRLPTVTFAPGQTIGILIVSI